MRPVRLVIQAFGPYSGREEIDFAGLSSKGLFLICGETGSGKTMILDAMTFALFGMSSGNTRDDFQALRCKGSENSTDTVVRFEFEHEGQTYAFERKLEFKRKNFTPTQNAYILEGGDLWRPLFENGKAADLKAKAVELLGLDYDQFRQVIILPQGQFEKLLVSNSDEKEKILSCIFGVNKWQKLADIMYDIAKNRYDSLKQLREQIETRLAEDGCSSLEEFEALRESVRAGIESLDGEYRALDCEGRIARLEEEIRVAEKFASLHQLEKSIREYESKAEVCARQEEGLVKAEKADTLRPLILTRDTDLKNKGIRETNLKKAENGLKRAVTDEQGLQATYDTLMAQKDKYEGDKALRATLQSAIPDYDRLENCRRRNEAAGAELTLATGVMKEAEAQSAGAAEHAAAVFANYTEADNTYRDMLARYTSDIVGSLAEGLAEGRPCPVCGSLTHPAKAQPVSGEPVSREKLDEAKDNRELLAGEHSKALDKAEEAKRSYDTAKDRHAAALTAERLASQELGIVMSGLVEGIDTKEALLERIRTVSKLLDDYEEKVAVAERKRNEATIRVRTCTAVVETAGTEYADACSRCEVSTRELEDAVAAAGFENEEDLGRYLKTKDEKDKARQYIANYRFGLEQCRKNHEELQKLLEGRAEPDAEACLNEKNGLMAKRDSYLGDRAGLMTKLQRFEEKYESLKKQKAVLDSEWNRADNDMVLVRNLRGDTGIGLQRYVLGIMFRSVIREANRMLENVHGGRYRLYTTDEKVKGSNKRGLDLKVEDMYHHDSEGRAVTTLSGGEKFLVSLALSIGMSSIAATGGIHIEAMFIDEGFGSLDSDSIEDAIGVLNTIRSANGMVGIISHVQLLRDTIPNKLVVHKARTGSTVSCEIG